MFKSINLLGISVFFVFFITNPVTSKPKFKSFSFSNFIHLKNKQHFNIKSATGKSKGKKLGQGLVSKINNRNLHLNFKAKISFYSISGDVKLKFLGKKKGKYLIYLDYKGKDNGISRSNKETVLVDSFMADRGILILKFMNGKRFIQLSVNKKGKNRFITEWGSAELVGL